MEQPVVVLFLDHSSDYAGGQKSLLALLRSMDKRKFAPLLVLDRGAHRMAKDVRGLGIEVAQIRYWNQRILQYMMLPFVLVQIAMLILRRRAGLVHANTFKSGALVALISYVIKVPFIFRARLGIIHLSHGAIDRLIYNRADLVLANSHYVKETFDKRFGSSDKVKVVYNPMVSNLKLNAVAVEDLRSTFIMKGTFYFAAIGRIEPFKRLHTIIEAAAELQNNGKNFKILMIGSVSQLDGKDYMQQLRQLIDSLSLREKIIFTGFVPEILEITSLLNAVILCSDGEALSRGVFESQSLGVPVIATRSGGNTELITHGETGLLFEVENALDLAKQMTRLLDEVGLSDEIAKNARVLVSQLFSPDNTSNKEFELIRELSR